MNVSIIQMNMKFKDTDFNYKRAEELIREAAKNKPDVITFPETFNTGFFPNVNIRQYCDVKGEKTKKMMSSLAKELNVNIVAGSATVLKDDKVYNTSYIYDRKGELVAEYDKVHLFSLMNEHEYYEHGNNIVNFELDGAKCSIAICYDIRFVEFIRTIALTGIDILFVVAQWPLTRKLHWEVLNTSRAIENQIYVVCTNSCGVAKDTIFGGHSAIISPVGDIISSGKDKEEIINGKLDLDMIKNVRNTINVYRDRIPDLYKIS